jgi:hypothetical protein
MTLETRQEPMPADLVLDRERTMRAMRRATRRVLLDHKLRGDPIAVWIDGRATWIPADEIVIPDPEEEEDVPPTRD